MLILSSRWASLSVCLLSNRLFHPVMMPAGGFSSGSSDGCIEVLLILQCLETVTCGLCQCRWRQPLQYWFCSGYRCVCVYLRYWKILLTDCNKLQRYSNRIKKQGSNNIDSKNEKNRQPTAVPELYAMIHHGSSVQLSSIRRFQGTICHWLWR